MKCKYLHFFILSITHYNTQQQFSGNRQFQSNCQFFENCQQNTATSQSDCALHFTSYLSTALSKSLPHSYTIKILKNY